MPEPVQDTTTATTAAAGTEKPALSFTAYEHVKSYPLVSESISYVSDIPYVSNVRTYADTYANTAIAYITSVSLLVSLANVADQYADSGLTSLDKTFPVVKNVSYSSTNNYITDRYNSVLERVNKNISSTYHSTDALRSSVSKTLQPVLKVTNDYFERALDFVLPVKEKVEQEAVEAVEAVETTENEVDRLLKLTKVAIERIRPFVSNVSSIPTHCRTVYSDEKSKGSTTSVALANTSRKLSSEAYDSLKPTIDKIIGTTKEVNGYVDNQVERVSKSVDGAVNSVLNAAEHAAGYGEHATPAAPVVSEETPVATTTGVQVNETS